MDGSNRFHFHFRIGLGSGKGPELVVFDLSYSITKVASVLNATSAGRRTGRMSNAPAPDLSPHFALYPGFRLSVCPPSWSGLGAKQICQCLNSERLRAESRYQQLQQLPWILLAHHFHLATSRAASADGAKVGQKSECHV